MSSKRSAVKPCECEYVANESHRSITTVKKMEVICRMGDGQIRPDVCRSVDCQYRNEQVRYIKQSMQHATTVSATQGSYSRSKLIKKNQRNYVHYGWIT
jgi:hypothetical protein